MKLTDEELKGLAEFAGGVVKQLKHGGAYMGGHYDMVERLCFPIGLKIKPADWDPLYNWNHLRLVLEALVRQEQRQQNWSWGTAWSYVLKRLSDDAIGHIKDFDFAEEINRMALATRKEPKDAT